jgi:hypothetical protein
MGAWARQGVRRGCTAPTTSGPCPVDSTMAAARCMPAEEQRPKGEGSVAAKSFQALCVSAGGLCRGGRDTLLQPWLEEGRGRLTQVCDVQPHSAARTEPEWGANVIGVASPIREHEDNAR